MREEKEGKKKRRIGILGILLLALLAAVVILLAVVYLRINVVDSGNQTRIAKDKEWFEKSDSYGSERLVDPDDISWYESGDTEFDKDVTNILLIGQDRRPGEERARADTMMILSIDSESNVITLVSMMRDMYLQIPGYSDNKLNAAYAFGGMELVDETIARNFGILIDGNVEVDFDGFQRVVSKLGGIDMELTAAEAEMMRGHGYTGFKEGKNHLNEDEALDFVRDRSMGGYDYSRTDRQRRLIMAVYESLKGQDVSKSISMVDTLLDYVTTDINPLKAVQYAIPVLNSLKDSDFHSYRIPADGTFYDANIEGMAVLVPDLLWNRIYLKNYLYGAPLENSESRKYILLKSLYRTNPEEFKKYDGYMRCTVDMKAYGILR